jgi:hypothetical protein
MRTGISICGVGADRQRLDALGAGRSTGRKHVWRAQIVRLSGAGVGTNGVIAATGKSRITVWRRQAPRMAQGLEGLRHDKTRPPGRTPASAVRAAAIAAMTLKPPPHEAARQTARAMAGTVGLAASRPLGLSVSTVQKIWKTHGLAPDRRRGFKRSDDPALAETPHDLVGRGAAAPAHAIVPSGDEKSRIQALDRAQPGLPLKKRRGMTMTHDYKYKRNAATTPFVALNIMTGKVFGQNMQRHRHQEFICFINAIERDIPAGEVIRAILDIYAAHKN